MEVDLEENKWVILVQEQINGWRKKVLRLKGKNKKKVIEVKK